jgi:hypothetical protein
LEELHCSLLAAVLLWHVALAVLGELLHPAV